MKTKKVKVFCLISFDMDTDEYTCLESVEQIKRHEEEHLELVKKEFYPDNAETIVLISKL